VFSLQATKGLWVNMKEWKGRYIYFDLHELFCVKFPCLLHEWLKIEEKFNSSLLPLEEIAWDQVKLDSLKALDKN
jgi:hypothetical protein